MQKFLISYYGGSSFETAEQGQAHMANWRAWMVNLADAVVDAGMAVGPAKTISSDRAVTDGDAGGLCGVTFVQAETMEQAIEMAKTCPHLDIDGSITVSQAMNMEM